MKNTILILSLSMLMFVACKQTKQGSVDDLITATSKFDKEKVGKLLSDNFIYSYKKGKILNRAEYLNCFDSLKNIEYKSEIISSQDLDSIIKTEEKVTNIIDSLLEVTPKIFQKKTYRFKEGKIKSIMVDSTLNNDEYYKSFIEKFVSFSFYVQDHHDIQIKQDEKEFYKNLKKYLTEYNNISVTDKKKYRNYSILQGTYISNDNPFYRELVFKGKTTVVIIDAIFGFSFPTSYILDEDYIRP